MNISTADDLNFANMMVSKEISSNGIYSLITFLLDKGVSIIKRRLNALKKEFKNNDIFQSFTSKVKELSFEKKKFILFFLETEANITL